MGYKTIIRNYYLQIKNILLMNDNIILSKIILHNIHTRNVVLNLQKSCIVPYSREQVGKHNNHHIIQFIACIKKNEVDIVFSSKKKYYLYHICNIFFNSQKIKY